MDSEATILLTGGTGTLGHAITRQVIAEHPGVKLRVLSRDEFKQQQMSEMFADNISQLTFILGDVRDKERVRRAMWGCTHVIHAAALKQVSRLEQDPREAVLTNVMGTQNVIDAGIDTDTVSNMVLTSTDKAVDPINLYGATKMTAEKLWGTAHAYAGGRGRPFFRVVRYGNVLTSRGSVVGLWREQSKKGVISITDPEMTRFVMSPRQAARLVLRATLGDEVGVRQRLDECLLYVPVLSSVTVRQLALATVDKKVKWRVIGMQPGEKIHETLLTELEASRGYGHFDFGNDALSFRLFSRYGVLTTGLPYQSNNNPMLGSEEDIRMLMDDD